MSENVYIHEPKQPTRCSALLQQPNCIPPQSVSAHSTANWVCADTYCLSVPYFVLQLCIKFVFLSLRFANNMAALLLFFFMLQRPFEGWRWTTLSTNFIY